MHLCLDFRSCQIICLLLTLTKKSYVEQLFVKLHDGLTEYTLIDMESVWVTLFSINNTLSR